MPSLLPSRPLALFLGGLALLLPGCDGANSAATQTCQGNPNRFIDATRSQCEAMPLGIWTEGGRCYCLGEGDLPNRVRG